MSIVLLSGVIFLSGCLSNKNESSKNSDSPIVTNTGNIVKIDAEFKLISISDFGSTLYYEETGEKRIELVDYVSHLGWDENYIITRNFIDFDSSEVEYSVADRLTLDVQHFKDKNAIKDWLKLHNVDIKLKFKREYELLPLN